MSGDAGAAESAVVRPLVFGEVLFDRFQGGSEVLGGAPFNVAWNLRGLGLDPLLVSRVGRDELGERILAAMGEWGLETSAVQRDAERATGTVEIELAGGEPRYDIAAPRAYDFIAWDEIPPRTGPVLLYHGSLALREATSARTAERLIAECRRAGASGEVFLDVNLRSPWWNAEALARWCATADVIKLNQDELSILVPGTEALDARARALLERTGARAIHVTRGARGAAAFTSDGMKVECPPSEKGEVVDTVGAGDAFASVLILGGLSRWPLERTLERARDFAQGVVGLRGATTTDAGFYERFLKTWSLV